jgi:hypothetical protein
MLIAPLLLKKNIIFSLKKQGKDKGETGLPVLSDEDDEKRHSGLLQG